MAATPRALVCGAGPAGLFLARRLLGAGTAVDLINRDHLPGGLLRYGVAPDHNEVRAALRGFDDIFTSPKLRYLGNVSLSSLRSPTDTFTHYKDVFLAVGAERPRQLRFSGEEHCAQITAEELFLLYNGHPSAANGRALRFLVERRPRRIAIIGNGNVSLDIARILTLPKSEVSTLSFPRAFADFLLNGAREVNIISRGGPERAACNAKELRELAFRLRNRISANAKYAAKPRTRAEAKKAALFNAFPTESATAVVRFVFNATPLRVESANRLIVRTAAESESAIGFDLLVKSLGFENGDRSDLAANASASVGWCARSPGGTLADAYISCEGALRAAKRQTAARGENEIERLWRDSPSVFRNENYLRALRARNAFLIEAADIEKAMKV